MIRALLAFIVIAVGGGLGSSWYMVEHGTALTTETSGPWHVWTAAGRPDADPYTRAHFVRHPELPITSALVLTYHATTDNSGRALHSACEYEIAGPEPRGAWWSLAAFDDRGELIRNDAERYSFNIDTAMRGPGGQIVIRLARNARPGNWLPTGGAGHLALVLQVQSTNLQALPDIRRVSC